MYFLIRTKNKFSYLTLLIVITITVYFSINLYNSCENFNITNSLLENNLLENNEIKIKNSLEIKKEDIINKINSNGILVTMNSTKLYCPEYKETLLECDDYSTCNNYVLNCPFGEK